MRAYPLTGMGGQPIGDAFLDVGQLVCRDVLAAHLAICGVFFLAWSLHTRGKVEPVISVDVALRNALTHGVKHTQCPLSAHIPLLSGLAIPPCRLFHIARDTSAVTV